MRQSIIFYLVFAVYFHSSFPVCINRSRQEVFIMLILFLHPPILLPLLGYEFYISHYGVTVHAG